VSNSAAISSHTTLAKRAEERADRFADYSESRAAEANEARSRVDEITQHIPLGQPIMIGHHLESQALVGT
jgi:hypothetical protein